MTRTASAQSAAAILGAVAATLLLSTCSPATEPGRFVPAGRPTAVDAGRGDLPPTVITQSFLDLVDMAGDSAPPIKGTAGDATDTPTPEAIRPRPEPAARQSPPATDRRRVEPLPPQPPATDRRRVEPLPPPLPAGVTPTTIAPPQPSAALELPDLALDDRDEPLTLAEVLQSVLIHYPLLQAVERERGIASGKLTTAMGAFDTNVSMAGNALAPGTYENYRSDFGLSQQFMTGGISAFGGFRTGYGDFPTYNLAQKTANAGEWRGGLTLPFAKNRDIDRPRAARAQAELDIALAEPTIERGRLDWMRAAARSYWAWQGSGERYGAGEQLLDLAVRRDGELAQKVARGATANIERIDNQQNIALRNGLIVQADRAMQQAAIDLSLYHRDASGRPLLARRSRMRQVPEPVQPTVLLYQDSLARALGSRPEFQRLSLQREKLLVERRLAANQTLPNLDGQLTGNQDAGFGKSALSGPDGLDRQVLQASLVFQLPAQRRDARGRLQTVESQLMQIDRQLSFAEDQVRAEVQDAFSLLERAYEFHKQARTRLDLARLVAGAEREQLRLGRSDVLRVTLREQAKFDAEIFEISARQEFWRAESDLRAADTSLGPENPGLLRDMTLRQVPAAE